MVLALTGFALVLSFMTLIMTRRLFGVVPVLAEAAKAYGISPVEIGRASLMGQPVHGLSPMVAALYLKCALLGVELVDLQRFALRWTIVISLVATAVALVTLAFPLAR